MQQKEDYDNEINFLDYISILENNIKLIMIIVAISVVSTGIISFISPKIYEATAVIMPTVQPQEQSGMSAIASQFGITSPQTSSGSEIISLLKSNILLERVIKKYNLFQVIFGKGSKGRKENEKIWDGIRYLKKKMYKVKDNKREGVIKLSVEFKDPEVSARILNYILAELTDYMSSEAKRVAETNKEYLESLIIKNADPLIKQKIYSLIARQIEKSMMAEVKENFAFKILDPPKVPDRKIKPRIIMNIALSFIIALFVAVLVAFITEYIGNVKKRRNREIKEK